MITQKQTSTALFTLCLGTFLSLLGCSLFTAFAIALVLGLGLLGISFVKKSLTSATTVIESANSCSVTVKRHDQKQTIEPSFLGKAHVTPTKNAPTGVTPNVQDIKQALNFKSIGNSTMTTPVKNMNKSVIRLQNSHHSSSAWPLNSTPIERKSVLLEPNYQMPIMKAINTQQNSPYSIKRSAVEKECSPPIVSQHKKPKTLPLKEGRSLKVPTVYVVHKKAESILKNKGNKRFLENNENVNDSKRRNKEEGEADKPQKRKLLSIVHITGKKHKVPSINSPSKYSRNTDLVVTNEDLDEDRRRNEERVRKLLSHKDDDTPVPSIKPAKEPVSTSDNIATALTFDKAETSKSMPQLTANKENSVPEKTAPLAFASTLPAAPVLTAPTDNKSSLTAPETPKSLPKSDAPSSDQPTTKPSESTPSNVVKSLFGSNSDISNKDETNKLPSFTLGNALVKTEQNLPSVPSLGDPKSSESNPTQQTAKPTFSFGSNTGSIPSFKLGATSSAATTTTASSLATPQFSFGAALNAPLATSTAPASDTKPILSFGSSIPTSQPAQNQTTSAPGFSLGTASSTPAFSFGNLATSTAASGGIASLAKPSTTTVTKPGFSFGGSQPPAAGSAPATSSAPTLASTISKPGFSFGSAATSSAATTATKTPAPGFSFGGTSASNTATFGSTSTGTSGISSTASTFGGSAGSAGFSFGGAKPTSTSAPLTLFGASTSTTPAFGAASSTTPAFGAASSTTPAFGAASSTTPAFGAASSTAPAFGAASSTAPAFGAASSTAPAFGAASSTTPAFGAASSTTPAFGAASSTAPAFGAASSTTPAFGAASSTAPAFGSSTTSSTSTAPSFGGTSSVFGASSSTGPAAPGSFSFGGSTTTAGGPAAGGFSFGSSNPTSTSTGAFSFSDNKSTVVSSSTPAFAPSAAPSTGGFNFGGTSAPATSTGMFGAPPAPPKAEGFSFGGGAPPAAAPGGFNFGGGATPGVPQASNTPPPPANLFTSTPGSTAANRRIATPRRRKAR